MDLNQKEWVTTGQAAKLLQCPDRTVRRYVHNGKIISKQHPITGRWKVSVASIQAIIATSKMNSISYEESNKIDDFDGCKKGLEKAVELIRNRIDYWKKLSKQADPYVIKDNIRGLQDALNYLQYTLNQK